MKRCSTSFKHHESANLNHSEIPLHTHLEWLKLKRLTTLNDGKDIEQLELSHIVGESIKWYNHFGKLVISYKVKPAIPLLGIYQEK